MSLVYLNPLTGMFDGVAPGLDDDGRTKLYESTLQPIAAAEIVTLPIPVGANGDVGDRAMGIEINGVIVGAANGGINDVDVSLYRCPDGIVGARDSEPIETARTLDLSTTAAPGAEEITNGDFSLGTGWDLGLGWIIAGGYASKAAGGPNTWLRQSFTASGGLFYLITWKHTSYGDPGRVHIVQTGGSPVREWVTVLPVNDAVAGQQNAVLFFAGPKGGSTLSPIVRIEFEAVGAEKIDDVSVKPVTPYFFSVNKRIDEVGAFVVLGLTPAADFGSTTWAYANYRRWTYY